MLVITRWYILSTPFIVGLPIKNGDFPWLCLLQDFFSLYQRFPFSHGATPHIPEPLGGGANSITWCTQMGMDQNLAALWMLNDDESLISENVYRF